MSAYLGLEIQTGSKEMTVKQKSGKFYYFPLMGKFMLVYLLVGAMAPDRP